MAAKLVEMINKLSLQWDPQVFLASLEPTTLPTTAGVSLKMQNAAATTSQAAQPASETPFADIINPARESEFAEEQSPFVPASVTPAPLEKKPSLAAFGPTQLAALQALMQQPQSKLQAPAVAPRGPSSVPHLAQLAPGAGRSPLIPSLAQLLGLGR